jgi:hypothetical protein
MTQDIRDDKHLSGKEDKRLSDKEDERSSAQPSTDEARIKLGEARDKDKTSKEEKQDKKTYESPSTPERFLLHGQMAPISKMKLGELREELQMWRNIWNWTPSEVKYYLARTGATMGLTMRNYKRYLGILLETHWELKEVELGVYDKAYDYTDGQYYFERKVIKVGANAILDVQWIAEREKEGDVIKQGEDAPSPESQAVNVPEGGEKND